MVGQVMSPSWIRERDTHGHPMMSETTVVDARLDKLEQDNRRLKLTVGALLLALAAVPLIGAVMPEQIQDVVRARAFYVEDENGNPRVQMNDRGITYRDENVNILAAMADIGIAYWDENGVRRVDMGEFGFTYYDENGNVVWSTACAPNC